MIKDLTHNEKLLAEYISEISECCFSAAWMKNVEYVLWDAVVSGPRTFGHGTIKIENINKLIQLSNNANSWIVFDDDTEEIAIPLDKWKLKFEIDVKQNPDILYKN